MNLDFVRSFVVFSEHLNFTHAAKQLHLSKPSLHTQIKRLGEEIGSPLYLRSGRKLVLTETGEQIAAFGRELKDRETQLMAKLRGEKAPVPLCVSGGNGALRYLLGPALKACKKDRLELRIRARSSPLALQDLRQGLSHLAVVATQERPSELETRVLGKFRQLAVLPKKHPLARKGSLSAKELANETLIVGPVESPHRQTLVQAIGTAEPLRVAVEARGWDLMIYFSQQRLGVAVVNEFVEVPNGLVGIPIKDIPPISYWLAWRRETSHPGLQTFIRALPT